MKRFAVILACLALVSCLKDERIVSGSDVPIGFTPMTNNIDTKAKYKGVQNATYTGSGSVYEDFYAWAKYTDAFDTNPKTGGIAFFDGETCIHGGSGTNDYWAPSPTYYWPKNGYLTFHAFSPSNLSPFSGTVTHDWTNGITITNFQAGNRNNNYRNELVDILYSDFVFKQQRSGYSPSSGVPYDESSEAAGYNHKGVNLTFHHALAGVQFHFKTDDDYKSGSVKYTFTSKKIELLYMNYKGEFHENRSAAANNTYRNAPAGSITFNNNNSTTATPYWIPNESNEFSDIIVSAANKEIKKTADLFGSLMLVVPQNLYHSGTGHSVSVRITYDFSYQVGNEAAHSYTGLTKTITLNDLPGKIGGTDYTIDKWLINHKYTYTIIFHLDPLLFDPYISVDWVDVSSIDIDLPYQS